MRIIRHDREAINESEMFEFECTDCGKTHEDEDEFIICDNCGGYVCLKCAIHIEHQGYRDSFCRKCGRGRRI